MRHNHARMLPALLACLCASAALHAGQPARFIPTGMIYIPHGPYPPEYQFPSRIYLSGNGRVIAGQHTITSPLDGKLVDNLCRWDEQNGLEMIGISNEDYTESSAIGISHDGFYLFGRAQIRYYGDDFPHERFTFYWQLPQEPHRLHNFLSLAGIQDFNSDGRLFVSNAHCTVAVCCNSAGVIDWHFDPQQEPGGHIPCEDDDWLTCDVRLLTAISGDGSFVVGSTRNQGCNPVIWYHIDTSNWSRTLIDAIPDSSGEQMIAWEISEDGSTVIGSASTEFDVRHAFYWTRETGTVVLDNSCVDSNVSDTNANGTIITGTIGNDAVLWDTTRGTRFLEPELAMRSLDTLGWSNLGISSISDDGTTIVGWGTNPDGQTEAYYLVLPRCPTDLNNDGDSNFLDLLTFLDRLFQGLPTADYNFDNTTNFFDLLDFLDAWFDAHCD